jgi:rhodanese-related sulfurtransferase
MNLLPITQVHPQTLKARLDAGEALVIVDVRETWEYSLAQILKELDPKSNMQKMHSANSDKPVLFYSLDTIAPR